MTAGPSSDIIKTTGFRPSVLWLLWNAVDSLFAIRAVGRQFVLLAGLIVLRRTLHRLRRIGRSAWRNFFSGLNVGRSRKRLEIINARRKCTDYETFHRLGVELDRLDGKDKWKEDPKSSCYDHTMIQGRINKYKELRKSKDLQGCMYALRGELLRKHFGICNPELFEVATTGTKVLVEKYVATVCKIMSWVAFSHRDPESQHVDAESGVTVAEKLAFFRETKHSFGRTALLLSGGASYGMKHFGVIFALHAQGLLPKIIAGSSAGSIIAAFVCSHTNEDLAAMAEPGFDWGARLNLKFFEAPSLQHFIRTGCKAMFTGEALEKSLKDNIGNMTFMEAYDKTGRICNITVSGLKGTTRYPMLLNYLSAPHVYIWSAVLASCALPGVFLPHELQAKDIHGNSVPYLSQGLKWQDGSMQSDLPMSRLAELFNVNYFIVSQVNPQAKLLSGIGSGSATGPLFTLAQFLRRQIKQYLLSVAELLLQQGGRRVSPFFRPVGFSPIAVVVQEYTGDVTIMPGPGFAGIHRVLANGTTKSMKRDTRESEWETWWYLPQIKTSCSIEFVMEEIITELQDELRNGGLTSNPSRPTLHQRTASGGSLLGRPEASGKLGGRVPSFIRSEHATEQTGLGAKHQGSQSPWQSRHMAAFASHTSLADLMTVGNSASNLAGKLS